jgi:hypothetical protein
VGGAFVLETVRGFPPLCGGDGFAVIVSLRFRCASAALSLRFRCAFAAL